MAGKSRKDHRGRVLPPNVSQKADLRYIWRKTIDGTRYTLTDNDLNTLKKKIIEKEAQIQNGIYSEPSKVTLNEWFYKWIETYKGNLRQSTKGNYTGLWESYVKDSKIGKMSISKIKRVHIVELLKELTEKKGLATATVHNTHIVIYGCLSDALEDGMILNNPAQGAFSKIKHKEPRKREALSVQQQEMLVSFIASSDIFRVHMPMFAFFLGTGARFGEMAGLTWKDIDLKKNVISINHTALYGKVNGKMQLYISKPKTAAGIREIPIIPELRKQLLMQKQYDLATGQHGNAIIDGYTDFVFHTSTGKPHTETGVNAIITRIVKNCNEQEIARAKKEHREPVLLPNFSPHILRHTFCTRFCENESNVKAIQKIMGHRKISTTMDIYTHVTEEKAQSVMEELAGKIKIC